MQGAGGTYVSDKYLKVNYGVFKFIVCIETFYCSLQTLLTIKNKLTFMFVTTAQLYCSVLLFVQVARIVAECYFERL